MSTNQQIYIESFKVGKKEYVYEALKQKLLNDNINLKKSFS